MAYMATPTLSIPTVTVADLETFHARHFRQTHANSQPFPCNQFPCADQAQNEQVQPSSNDYTKPPNNDASTEYVEEWYGDHDDDDGLGYYPDGVKRTLTDEQIAMFRHSEIQTLLRERRKARENAEADADAQADADVSDEEGQVHEESQVHEEGDGSKNLSGMAPIMTAESAPPRAETEGEVRLRAGKECL